MINNNTASWLALKKIPQLGNRLFIKLLERFKTVENIFSAPEFELMQIEGINRNIIQHIATDSCREQVDHEIELVEKESLSIITYHDNKYPPHLKNIFDPPPVLFVKGDIINADSAAVSIVGTRSPSRYGLMIAEQFGSRLAHAGFTIISGLAVGIDTAAHKGAVPNRTIAVLGSGLANIYPAQNRKLAEKIAENGAVISEFFPSETAEPYKFPVRNRVISGMSYGTLVVEGKIKSGSLITARLASEQGRDVFAVPGNINSVLSKGTNGLIKQGAVLVEQPEDIIEVLLPLLQAEVQAEVQAIEIDRVLPDPMQINELTLEESKIIDLLSRENMTIDEIVNITRLESSIVSSSLLLLELNDMVTKGPGGIFNIKPFV